MSSFPHFGPEAVRSGLPMTDLIEAVGRAFAEFDSWGVPDRHHHSFDAPAGSTATMLLMPAWRRRDGTDGLAGNLAGVKIANIFPANPGRGLPAVSSIYVLMSADTGRILATMDGAELTRLRTAAASGAASSRLARPDSSVLLMMGAGALAGPLIRAHSCVRPIETVLLWNRTRDRAERLAASLGDYVTVVDDPGAAIARADIVSCATMSTDPIVPAAAVRPGTHVDLVGAYRPDMREADSDLVRRAEVFVDTRAGALAEAGDLLIPIQEGMFGASDVRADLSELCSGLHPGRKSDDDITLFKSVGHALEDLVAASLVHSDAAR